MNLKHIFVVLLFIFLITIISGCSETENPPTNNIQKGIVGTWFKEEIINNIKYRTVYDFLPNLSFFSGVWDSDSNSYSYSVRGTYECNEEYINFTTPGVNTEWDIVVMKYSISEDGNELKLFYGESENYELFIRES